MNNVINFLKTRRSTTAKKMFRNNPESRQNMYVVGSYLFENVAFEKYLPVCKSVNSYSYILILWIL